MSQEERRERFSLPRPLVTLLGYSGAVILFSFVIIQLKLPDQLIILMIAAIFLMSYFYPRWVYLPALAVTSLSAVWITYHRSSSFSSSLETITTATLIVGVVTELTHKLITDRVRAEEALRQSEEQIRAIAQTAFDAIVSTDDEGRITFWNRSAEVMFGYGESEILGQPLSVLLPEPYRRAHRRVLARLRRAGEEARLGRTLEFEGQRKDGRCFPIEISVAVGDAGGEYFFTTIGRDITERKLAEEALNQRATELEERNAELDAFAHTVAHDLKNPLSALVASSALLEGLGSQLSMDRVHTYVRIIAQQSHRMNAIVDELLLLSSVRKEDVVAGSLDMGAIVQKAQERVADLIDEHQAEIALPETWPVALGYAPWIEEVWANYLSNAIKYGGRPPRIELGASLPTDGQVRFWIADNGPGLSPEETDRLFVPFERLDQVRVEGHGLGLSIVRRIVEKLGGQVGIETGGGPDGGSVFFFILPAAGVNSV